MAIKALSGLEPQWYEPPGQDEDEPKTRFELMPLNGRQFMSLTNALKADFITPDIDARADIALKYGLIGWENFCGKNGEDIKFSKDNIDLIPSSELTRIVDEIVICSSMGDEDRKNS